MNAGTPDVRSRDDSRLASIKRHLRSSTVVLLGTAAALVFKIILIGVAAKTGLVDNVFTLAMMSASLMLPLLAHVVVKAVRAHFARQRGHLV